MLAALNKMADVVNINLPSYARGRYSRDRDVTQTETGQTD